MVFLDSGSHDAMHRSSGMTVLQMFTGPDKKPSIACLFFACLLSLGNAYSACAGTLSIRIRATVVAENHLLQGTVDIANQGNEAAFRVQTEILFPSGSVMFPEVPRLNASESKTFSLEHKLGGVKNGTSPLPIIVTFHDINLYPFSALSCPTFTVGEEPKQAIRYKAEPVTVGKEGTALIYLENAESQAKNLTATIFLPKEFTSSEKERKIHLEPAQRETLSFEIVNRYALPGATYPVFLLFQYDTQELHHTSVCQVMTTVTEGKNWFYRSRWVWLAGGLALLLFMVAKRWMSRPFRQRQDVDSGC